MYRMNLHPGNPQHYSVPSPSHYCHGSTVQVPTGIAPQTSQSNLLASQGFHPAQFPSHSQSHQVGGSRLLPSSMYHTADGRAVQFIQAPDGTIGVALDKANQEISHSSIPGPDMIQGDTNTLQHMFFDNNKHISNTRYAPSLPKVNPNMDTPQPYSFSHQVFTTQTQPNQAFYSPVGSSHPQTINQKFGVMSVGSTMPGQTAVSSQTDLSRNASEDFNNSLNSQYPLMSNNHSQLSTIDHSGNQISENSNSSIYDGRIRPSESQNISPYATDNSSLASLHNLQSREQRSEFKLDQNFPINQEISDDVSAEGSTNMKREFESCQSDDKNSITDVHSHPNITTCLPGLESSSMISTNQSEQGLKVPVQVSSTLSKFDSSHNTVAQEQASKYDNSTDMSAKANYHVQPSYNLENQNTPDSTTVGFNYQTPSTTHSREENDPKHLQPTSEKYPSAFPNSLENAPAPAQVSVVQPCHDIPDLRQEFLQKQMLPLPGQVVMLPPLSADRSIQTLQLLTPTHEGQYSVQTIVLPIIKLPQPPVVNFSATDPTEEQPGESKIEENPDSNSEESRDPLVFSGEDDGVMLNQVDETGLPRVMQGIHLDRVKEFAAEFKAIRIKLGLTQTQVGKALQTSAGEGNVVSQSTICRFEKLEITALQVKRLLPILQGWLTKVKEKQSKGIPIDLDSVLPSSDGKEIKKRKKRTVFSDEMVAMLNAEFGRDQNPNNLRLTEIANLVGLDKETVRVWFSNRRQTERKLNKE